MRSIVFLLLLGMGIHLPMALAVEKVTVRRERDDVAQELSGQILDYDRTQLILQNGDQQRAIPADTIVGIEADWGSDHVQARQYATAGKWEKAIEAYAVALRHERRRWAQQEILRDLALAYRAHGDVERAGDVALTLISDFPRTRAVDALPLAWTVTHPDPALARQARVWLTDQRSPAARLLGASWLLSGPTRGQALSVLQELSRESEAWLAQLATAQIWRALLAQVTATECRRWERMIESMPASLRAGPLYVLGQAWQRQGETQRAVLTLMRIPVLHSDQESLAIAALMSAAELLSQADEMSAAASLYREIVTRYPYSKQADEARRLYDMANPGREEATTGG